MCYRFYFLLLILIAPVHFMYATSAFNRNDSYNNTDSLLKVLDQTVENRSLYTQKRESKIVALKQAISGGLNIRERYDIYDRIFNQYSRYDLDSALYYAKAKQECSLLLNDKELTAAAFLNISEILGRMGMYKESLDVLNTINSKSLNATNKVYYYHLQHSLYLLMEENSLSQDEKTRYQYTILQYKDSLIKILPPNDIVLATMRKGKLLSVGQYEQALQILDSCLLKNSTNEFSKGILNYEISDVYERMGNTEQQKKYLIIASICDLQRGVRSYIALRKLAILLFKEDDIERANTYIQVAMEDAILCRARFRVLEISETLPIITEAYNKQKQEDKQTLFISLILISILSVVLIISIICILKQAKKRSATKKELDKMYEEVKVMNMELLNYNKQLSESNIIKEEYIRTVFYLCSTYIDKMEAYRANMNRKLKAGKTQEVILITSQTNLVSNELKDFFQLFDAIFMKLYPTFIDDFNSHLLDNEKIYCKNDDILAPELRVFALMKLGITDSSKVAMFLHYSPQTIYNYKLKVKNKLAISKEEFSRIMNINW